MEKKDKFFDNIDVDLIHTSFFVSMFKRSAEYYGNNKILKNYPTKIKPGPNFYSRNKFSDQNEKQYNLKKQHRFKNIETLAFLFSFLFPKLGEDIIQINTLNRFIFPSYIEQCIQYKFFNRVFDFKFTNIWYFYTFIFKVKYDSIAKPEHLKNFIMYRFNSFYISPVQTTHGLKSTNRIFEHFYLF